MDEKATVRIERDGPVFTVIIGRPEARNAVDGPTAARLADAFRQFEADEDAAVAVLWGEGGTFCAGADLKAVGTGRGNRVLPDGDGPMGPTRMRLGKPVIAAVAGHAVAGGLELALWCDLRVVEEDAVFGVFCRRWGVPLVDGGTVRLPRLIGESRAMDLILTGRPVGAAEALDMGLANRIVPRAAPGRRRRNWHAGSRAFPSCACATTASRSSISTVWRRRTHSPPSTGTGSSRSGPARPGPAPTGSWPARGGTARSRSERRSLPRFPARQRSGSGPAPSAPCRSGAAPQGRGPRAAGPLPTPSRG